jgi:hypothetical protein
MNNGNYENLPGFRRRSASCGGRVGGTTRRDNSAYAGRLQRGEAANGACIQFWVIGPQTLASESKSVQSSRTIIFGDLILTGLIAV